MSENSKRYTQCILPNIEECVFGDDIWADKTKQTLPLEGISGHEESWGDGWKKLERYLTKKQHGKAVEEILYWMKRGDVYSTALLLKVSWESIRSLFEAEQCPKEIAEFVQQLCSTAQ